MAEFCECGSLIIDGRCTNKSCTLRAAAGPSTVKKHVVKAKTSTRGTAAPKPVKIPNPRRASKCITYNLYDNKDKDKDMGEESGT